MPFPLGTLSNPTLGLWEKGERLGLGSSAEAVEVETEKDDCPAMNWYVGWEFGHK